MRKKVKKMIDRYLKVVENQDKKTKLLLTFSAVGVLFFLVLGSALPFRQRLFRILFPKATSSAAPAPFLARVEQIPGNFDSSLTGSSWGGQLGRIVRMSNGDIYHTVLGATDTSIPPANGTYYHKFWHLAKRDVSTGSWSVYDPQGAGGKDVFNAPEVLRTPGDSLYIVSFVNQLPQLWSSVTNSSENIPPYPPSPAPQWSPNYWHNNPNLTTNALEASHPSTSVNSLGDLLVTEVAPNCTTCNTPDAPGHFKYAVKQSNAGALGGWLSFADYTQQPVRHPYDFSILHNDRSFVTSGTGDFYPAELGYAPLTGPILTQCPGCAYAFEGIKAWLFSNPSSTTPTVASIFEPEDPQNCINQNGVRVAVDDGYEDTLGRYHILYTLHASSNGCGYSAHHAIVQNGAVVKDVTLPLPNENFGRIIQDTTGRFYFLSVATNAFYGNMCVINVLSGTDSDTDGTSLNPLQVIPFNTGNDCSGNINHFIASPRHGTPLADYVDGIVTADAALHAVYYRLQFYGGSVVTSSPSPASSASPSPAPSASPSGSRLTGKINAVVYPQPPSINVGDTFQVLITATSDISANPNNTFNAAQADVAVSPELAVQSLSPADPAFGPCGFTYVAAKTPTAANPSFAGAMVGGGQAANSCTVYQMTVKAVSAGVGTISFANGSIKAYSDQVELFSGFTPASVTIGGVGGSPVPSPTPSAVSSPSPSVVASASPVASPSPSASPVPQCLGLIHRAGDDNGDGVINDVDLSLFGADWQHTTAQLINAGSDFNCDGIVDLTDLSIIAKNYGS